MTKKKYRDFRLHVEFLVTKQGGNSGVYLQNRYEIQVLDGDRSKHGMGAVINETESPYHSTNGPSRMNYRMQAMKSVTSANGIWLPLRAMDWKKPIIELSPYHPNAVEVIRISGSQAMCWNSPHMAMMVTCLMATWRKWISRDIVSTA